MIRLTTLSSRRAGLRAVAGALLLITGAACSSDGVGPSSEAALPADSTASAPTDTTITPADSTVTPPIDSTGIDGAIAPVLDTRSPLPGIVFATGNLPTQLLNAVHTGTKFGGSIGPSNVLSVLADARARGGRVFVKLSMGSDNYVKNPDGTFSLTKWKALIDRYRSVNIIPYITDGTIAGHFLIDEPHRTVKWGGKIIPHATLEAMAQYSKQIWPGMNTFVHTQMGWLTSTPTIYRYLDAGWIQYAAGKGEVTKWVTSEIDLARRKGLGLLIGLNVLAGGDPRLGIKGFWPGKYAMSGNELRSYGTAVLNQSYSCAFMMVAYDPNYYGRPDIRAAMADISVKAKTHVKTSCSQ